ncbi:MAG TPA: pyridoxal-phosphate dependent enzyme [Chitinophagaceae bacterium]|nr:pyridoxal-phosphate dependent enzyme [Chitinophagaceae bacterium]HNJ58722.1 pyridoxal-phosphate dependent enzyme [Chitinophagaceae bacterium]
MNVAIQKLQSNLFNNIEVEVLRTDEIHLIVSGNKWFKLKYYIQDCIKKGKETLATFGGTYSNHIVATAYACKSAGLKSIGIIRGEATKFSSHTLKDAESYGMELHFVSREMFKEKEKIYNQFNKDVYWVNEGGLGALGSKGASEILLTANTSIYTHIICACGTGTMCSGLISGALPNQKVIGISILKGNNDLENVVNSLVSKNNHASYSLLHNYHFGGYAKHPLELIQWMNELHKKENLPTDIVYTSKLFYAVKDLCNTNYFTSQDKVLVIHSGGLQGNLSLPKNTLRF